jgi:MFS family permease
MISILRRKRQTTTTYTSQFWLLFWGSFFTRASISMLWPFVTVVIRERLEIPLTIAALLLTIQSVSSLLSTLVVSSIMDKIGRKLPTVASLIGSTAVFAMMATANTLEQWVILMIIYGAFVPVFGIGVNTMVADVVEPQKRSSAYALIRMIDNAGIAIGPMMGGALVTLMSFEAVYFAVAIAYGFLTIFVMLMIRETIPQHTPDDDVQAESSKGYGYILRDTVFMSMFAMFLLVMFGNAQIFVLLPVYAKENFGLIESQYSLLLTINATMVVLFQYVLTKFTDRYRPLNVMAVAAFIYTIGLGTVAIGYDLTTFSISMIIVTFGELMLMPTTLTFVANIAPTELRARYMGLFGLNWSLAAGIGPVIGGYLNDNHSPVAIWIGASAMAFVGTIGFLSIMVYRRNKKRHVAA